MDLTKLIPKETSFKLRQVEDQVFHMRPINLQDEIWLAETYPGDEIEKIFTQMDIKEISRVVFRLLKPEDKKFFAKREVEIIDEDGESETVEIGGVVLLQSLISGWEEKGMILETLLENIGLSRPQIASIKGEKKSTKKATKKKAVKKK